MAIPDAQNPHRLTDDQLALLREAGEDIYGPPEEARPYAAKMGLHYCETCHEVASASDGHICIPKEWR